MTSQTIETKPRGVLGVTDNPRPPIVAKAKIGEKVGDPPKQGEQDRRPPRRLDYIKFVEPTSGAEIPEFKTLFGEKPTSFIGVLPSDDLESFTDVAWKRWGARGIKCQGNGEYGVDQETGERLQCAGPYLKDNLAGHLCPYARPTTKPGRNGEEKVVPPECKPVFSLSVVVPQIPGLGVVKLDTGGVASSIQTLDWQFKLLQQFTGGKLAGIAVKIFIRPFKDKFGAVAYSWMVQPLSGEEAKNLQYAAPARVLAQLADQVQAAQLEAPDADLYGLPAAGETYDEPTEAQQEIENRVPAQWAAEIAAAEALYQGAAGRLPAAKGKACLAIMEENHASASASGEWADYLAWLESATGKMELQTARMEQGALL